MSWGNKWGKYGAYCVEIPLFATPFLGIPQSFNSVPGQGLLIAGQIRDKRLFFRFW